MVTLAEVLEVIRTAAACGTAGLEDALDGLGLDAGEWVLVSAAAWLWLLDAANDPDAVGD